MQSCLCVGGKSGSVTWLPVLWSLQGRPGQGRAEGSLWERALGILETALSFKVRGADGALMWLSDSLASVECCPAGDMGGGIVYASGACYVGIGFL